MWLFGLRAISLPPRPPRAAPPPPYPSDPAPRFPTTIPRAAYKPGARVNSVYRRWCGPPNPPLKRTPLRGPNTPAILPRDLDTRVVSVYHGGAA